MAMRQTIAKEYMIVDFGGSSCKNSPRRRHPLLEGWLVGLKPRGSEKRRKVPLGIPVGEAIQIMLLMLLMCSKLNLRSSGMRVGPLHQNKYAPAVTTPGEERGS